MWEQATTSSSMDAPTRAQPEEMQGMVQVVSEQSASADANVTVSAGGSFDTFQTDGVLLPHPVLYSRTHGQVMTDEQMEILRRQISVYATICQQLVEMHKAIVAQQSALPGFRLGHPIPYDSMMTITGHKMTARQRWTPTQMQLQILENIFDQGNGTPSKQKIKEITAELTQHGQISETNVYNWFQNRRARTKRKQQLGLSNNGESEVETDLESPKEKKAKMDHNPIRETPVARQTDMSFPCSDQHHFESQQHASAVAFRSHIDSKSVMSFSRFPSFEDGLTAARNGQLIGVDEPVDNFNLVNDGEGYPMLSTVNDLGVTASILSESTYRRTK